MIILTFKESILHFPSCKNNPDNNSVVLCVCGKTFTFILHTTKSNYKGLIKNTRFQNAFHHLDEMIKVAHSVS